MFRCLIPSAFSTFFVSRPIASPTAPIAWTTIPLILKTSVKPSTKPPVNEKIDLEL